MICLKCGSIISESWVLVDNERLKIWRCDSCNQTVTDVIGIGLMPVMISPPNESHDKTLIMPA